MRAEADLFRAGLTGNVAGGKSSVARVWERLGARVVDADELARRAVQPGSRALRRIADRFGDEVLQEDGSLDRDAMRRRVFSDPDARRELESLVHPEVARLRTEEEARLRRRGARIVVHAIPLLFEVGLTEEFDAIVLVDAPADVRVERLVRDRGLDEDEAWAVVRAQMPAAEKRERADHVIDNDGSLEELERKARAVWRELERASG